MLRAGRKSISAPAIYGRFISTTTTRSRHAAVISRFSERCNNNDSSFHKKNREDRSGCATPIITTTTTTATQSRNFASSSRGDRRQDGTNSSNNNNNNNKKSGQQQYFGTLRQVESVIDKLLTRVSRIWSPSFELEQLVSARIPTKNERRFLSEIANDTRTFFSMIITSVDRKQFNPRGKHGKELSRILELVLFVFSRLDLPDMYDEVTDVLMTLHEWNLDVRNRHYDYAIVTANRESRWREASDMFWRQISPEAGHNPVDLSISSPHGLYAIAKWAQDQDAAVVENVFDAVQQLSMVSPSDQRTYILAAGTALGYAGEGEAAVHYYHNSSNASQFGKTLTASVMQACLLSDRFDEALEIYDSNVASGIDTEWQWGGESDIADPLCRDLALRAMHSRQGASDFAVTSFQEILSENESSISLDAILGIALACEQDSNFSGALSVLLALCENSTTPGRIVTSDEMFLEKGERNVSEGMKNRTFEEDWLPRIGEILASTMRTCNATSRFGTSLFCFKLISLYAINGRASETMAKQISNSQSNLHESVFDLAAKTKNLDELITPIMVALCGLRCSHQATSLFEDAMNSRGFENEEVVRLVYEAALSEVRTVTEVGNAWSNAARHISILVEAARVVQLSSRVLTVDEKACFQNVLATAMQACTAAHQPDLSLFLLTWVESVLESRTAGGSNLQTDWTGINVSDRPMSFETMSDSLLAQCITAHRWNKETRTAVELFERLLESKSGELDQWRLSTTAGFHALDANRRQEDVWSLFKAMPPDALTTESYTIVGHILARKQKWNDLANVYRSAVERGHLSEELGMLAMKAIVFTKVDNKLRVLRSIVNDCASVVGLDPISWTDSKYWHLKRSIGFDTARLLMWWNDPDRCHVDELNFAIQNFEEQQAAGLKAKNDVIRVIVTAARSFDPSIMVQNANKWQHVPISIEDWKLLFQKIIEETKTSTLRYDTSFVRDLVEASLLLDCTEECTDFIANQLATGSRLNKKALVAALEAAKLEESEDLVNDIVMVLSEGNPES